MTFFEKNEENLEALVFALTEREKSTIAIGIIDNDDTRDKAIAYLTQQFKDKQNLFFDVFGQKINSLLAFFKKNLPRRPQNALPIVHLTRLDPLLFTSENHKVVSSQLVAQINMERELLFHELNALIVLWITRAGYNRLRMDAPDFMDWVVAAFEFENNDDAHVQTLSANLPQETIEDRSNAAIHELKEKAEKLAQRTHKFEHNKKYTIKDYKEYFNLLLALIDAYKNLHDLENTQNTIKKAYNLAKENNLANGFEFGKLLVNWGDIETQLGNLDKAMALFEEALAHFELLEDKFNIAVTYEKLGATHTALGNLDKALHFYEERSKLGKELYGAYPNNVEFKNGLAISYSKLGDTHTALGNLDKALRFYEERSKLGKELYDAYLNNVSFKNGLAISYSKLGETHTALGNLDKALRFYEDDLKLTKELYEAYPNNENVKNGLAISYEKLGETHRALGNFDKALRFYEDEVILFKELYKAYPNNVEFKNGLAISYEKLGSTHTALGNLDEALRFYEERSKLGKELYEAYPNNVSFKNGLAISYSKLGSIYLSKDDFLNSKNNFKKSLYYCTQLLESSPQNVEYQSNYAEFLSINNALILLNKEKGREEDFQKALTIWNQLYERSKNPYYQKMIIIINKMVERKANLKDLIIEISAF